MRRIRLLCWVRRNEHVVDVAGQVTGHVPQCSAAGCESGCGRPVAAAPEWPQQPPPACTAWSVWPYRRPGRSTACSPVPNGDKPAAAMDRALAPLQPVSSCASVPVCWALRSCLVDGRAALARPGFERFHSIISHPIRRSLGFASNAPRHGPHVRSPAGGHAHRAPAGHSG